MSVIVKGMKMPAAGVYTCELGVIDEKTATLTIHTPINKPQISYKLVTIPAHGRLIDADALAEDLEFDVENDQRALDDMDIVGNERTRLQFDKDCKQNCMWYLTESPTVIEAEEGKE